MIPRIQLIDDKYTPPSGALGLGQQGWIPDVFERLSILSSGTMDVVLDRVMAEYSGLLGPGELVFATPSLEGKPDRDPNGTPCIAYQGYLIFIPEDLEANEAAPLRPPEIPPDTPEDIATFIKAHWGDFRKMARAAEPDSVLIVWMGQQNLAIQAIPRVKLIESEPETVPETAKQGPLPLEDGAEITLWLAICSQVEDNVSVSWCAVSFYPEG